VLTPFILRPDLYRVFGKRAVTLETRIPIFAAFELYRDNILIALVVSTSGLGVDARSGHLVPVDLAFHLKKR
jgi:hypothetical protein